MLRKTPGLQVVGEAFDGLDAVQKAAELKPDLILLDIGLPRLNGIEAARANLQTFLEIQNSIRDSGIRCRDCARRFQSGGVGLRFENKGCQRPS